MRSYQLAYGIYKYFALKYFGESKPFGCSLAPTIKCNLKCPQCYEQDNRASGKEELTLEAMDALAEKLSRQGMKHCTLTDGEPLVSRESREKCETIIKHFWMSFIVTNGTVEIPDFPASYILSLDGPPGIHDKLRGVGVFAKLRENVKKSPTDDIYGLCTLNTINHGHIPETISTAQELGLRGLMFNWYNPSGPEDQLWLNYEARNRDIDLLLSYIEKDPGFIYNSPFELEVLRTPDWTANCPAHWVPSYDAFGELKKPCIFGERAICQKCGCHVFPSIMESLANGRMTPQFRIVLDYVDDNWMRAPGTFRRITEAII